MLNIRPSPAPHSQPHHGIQNPLLLAYSKFGSESFSSSYSISAFITLTILSLSCLVTRFFLLRIKVAISDKRRLSSFAWVLGSSYFWKSKKLILLAVETDLSAYSLSK